MLYVRIYLIKWVLFLSIVYWCNKLHTYWFLCNVFCWAGLAISLKLTKKNKHNSSVSFLFCTFGNAKIFWRILVTPEDTECQCNLKHLKSDSSWIYPRTFEQRQGNGVEVQCSHNQIGEAGSNIVCSVHIFNALALVLSINFAIGFFLASSDLALSPAMTMRDWRCSAWKPCQICSLCKTNKQKRWRNVRRQ